MGKISVLSEQVANQIAAGEVIERPASIVKELVENSIDAGATAIEIEFKKGGSSYIRIEDNGWGMSPEDAALCFERHATSKIVAADDLNTLTSMGFRGEALPSIASVSRFQLQTRVVEAKAGTDILIDAGKVIHNRDCGMPTGTRMTVSQLFNSVPARRKFLKSVATESAHIIHHARLYALAHPEIAFTLIDDGRTLFRTPACGRLRDRIMEIFGKQIAGRLIEIDAEEKGMRMTGLIGEPGHSRSSRHEMLVFVNNRPVENRTLSYALIESYYGHIPKGRYPVAFLFLELPPSQVDVNVHPAKREVRFRNESSVRGFAVRSILEALRASLEASGAATVSRAASPPAAKASPPSAPILSIAPAKAPGPPVQTSRKVTPSAPETDSAGPPETPVEGGELLEKSLSQATDRETKSSDESSETSPPESVPEPSRSDWRFIGWSQGEYALFDTDAGLVVLNCRAARKRVWYESLLEGYRNNRVESQKLLLPVPVEFDPVSSAILTDNAELLEAYGMEVALFGRNFFRIEAVPSWLPESEAESYLGDWLDLLRRGEISDKSAGATQTLLARRAADKIVLGAKPPSDSELMELVDRLFETRNPLADPDGRPTFFELSSSELKRRFHLHQR